MGHGVCKGCGKPVLWVKDPDDSSRNICVDTAPIVYCLEQTEGNGFSFLRANQKFNMDAPLYFVSHYAVCPDANGWEKKIKEKRETDAQSKAAGDAT